MITGGMTDVLDIRITGDVQKLSLKPGDKLVLRTERHLTPEQREQVAKFMKHAFPRNEYIVIEKMTLEVVSETS